MICKGCSGDQSITLTTGADNWTGTGGNDFVNGTGDTSPTLNAADIINGGTGSDTMSITYTAANTDATMGAQISNVEIFNVRNTAATGAVVALDATKTAGLTAANLNLSTGDLTVTGLATGASVGIIGNGTLTSGILSYDMATATNAATINLSGGVKQAAATAQIVTTANQATSATINSTGATNLTGGIELSKAGAYTVTALTINAASSLTVDDGGAGTAEIVGFKAAVTNNTITVTGAASAIPTGQQSAVNLGLIDATIGTLDASAMTAGGVSAALGAATTKFVGGAGKDVVSVAALNMTATVDGGAGTSDTIGFTADTNYATTATKISNFEILKVGATADSAYNYALITGLTGVDVAGSAANAITVSNLGATTPVTVSGDVKTNTKLLTLGLATNSGATDVLALTLNNATASTATQIGNDGTGDGLKTVGVETWAITSSNKANTVYVADTTTGLKYVTVAGTVGLTFNSSTYNALLSYDGSADAAAQTIKVATPASTTSVTGGAGNDTISTVAAALNSTNLTINGGAGTNTLQVSDSTAVLDGGFATITNVSKLDLSAAAGGSVTLAGWANGEIVAAGGTLTITDTGATGTTGTGVTSAVAIDASALTTAKVNVTVMTNVGGAAASIKSGAAADTIKLDVANAADASSVQGGKGADAITLVHTAAAVVTLNYALNDVASGTTLANADTITGFVGAAGKDVLQVTAAFGALKSADAAVTTVAYGADTASLKTLNAIDITATGANKAITVLDLTTAVNSNVLTTQAGIDEVVGYLTANVKATSEPAGTHLSILVHDAQNNVAVFNYTEAATSGIQAAELSLVGVLAAEVGTFAAGNFA